jgi:addiction module HigA family antidote
MTIIMSALDAAKAPADLDKPGFTVHALAVTGQGGAPSWCRGTGASPLDGMATTRPTSIWRTIMATSTLRHPSIEPAHPGEMLARIVIPGTGKSKSEIARLLRISRQTLYDILTRKQPVTPNVAVRLGKLFGGGPMMWVNMQSAYDVWHAEREVDTSGIPTLDAA